MGLFSKVLTGAAMLLSSAQACSWSNEGTKVSNRYNFWCKDFHKSAAHFSGEFYSVHNDKYKLNMGT